MILLLDYIMALVDRCEEAELALVEEYSTNIRQETEKVKREFDLIRNKFKGMGI